MTLKKDIEKILTRRNKLSNEIIVPKISVDDNEKSCVIFRMPRTITKLQIDMLMQITNGIDYELVVQRGSDKYMMILIQKSPMKIKGIKGLYVDECVCRPCKKGQHQNCCNPFCKCNAMRDSQQ